MKTPAIILLVSFALFLTETASFPPNLVELCKKASCTKTKCEVKKKKGGMKETKCGMKETKCSGKKDTDKKTSGDCKEKPNCTYCPVCSVFTFPPQYELSLTYLFFTKKYPLINCGHTAAYIPPVWKPPNDYSPFSKRI